MCGKIPVTRLHLPAVDLRPVEKPAVADAIIRNLHLARSADSRVGDDDACVVSGGEPKHTAIILDLIGCPVNRQAVVRLKLSPTLAVIKTLRRDADHAGRIVVATIHQPPYACTAIQVTFISTFVTTPTELRQGPGLDSALPAITAVDAEFQANAVAPSAVDASTPLDLEASDRLAADLPHSVTIKRWANSRLAEFRTLMERTELDRTDLICSLTRSILVLILVGFSYFAWVHANSSMIVMEVRHTGRQPYSNFRNGAHPATTSGIHFVISHACTVDYSEALCETNSGLSYDEITAVFEDYSHIAELVKLAGFDEVNIHAANGYLIDQVLQSATNHQLLLVV
ncbi:hypothetical protein HK405_010866 [Cladochytrium tenue]|nr:hypothetical protein HK405_010866 [Cladochytrium tenue]